MSRRSPPSCAMDPLEPRVLLAAMADFNGDGKDDLLWRNQETGANVVWFSGKKDNTAPVQGLTDTDWVIGEVADFNGDGKADIVWRNTATGANAIWLMDGRSRAESVALPGLLDPAWRIRAAGDFDGDGDADIFWRNLFTGANALWILEDLRRVDVVALPGEANNYWEVAGAADADGDGDDDVFWLNTDLYHLISGGPVRVWRMEDAALFRVDNPSVWEPGPTQVSHWGRAVGVRDFQGQGLMQLTVHETRFFRMYALEFSVWGFRQTRGLPTQADPRWHAKDRLSSMVEGDLNGDGFADLFNHSTLTGDLEAVNVNPVTGETRTTALAPAPSGDWRVTAVVDVARRGWPDLFLRNTVTGQHALWLMRGHHRFHGRYIQSAAPEWEIAAAHDFNGDRITDFVLVNRDTSQVVAWKPTTPFATTYTAVPIAYLPGPDHTLASRADFNGDGVGDLLWRDAAADSTVLWTMDGFERVATPWVGSPGPGWLLADAADFDRDGHTDLLWRHPTSGATRVWRMNANVRQETVELPLFDPGARVVGARDLDTDGGIEIIFHNAASGAVTIWRMRGTTRVDSFLALSRPGAWRIQLPG